MREKCKRCKSSCPELNTCDDAEYWVDPAGGVHKISNSEEGWSDPAAMYE